MGVEGIGASVVRKEDRRFVTGKGRYVDDIKLQGMTYAHFVRSPHAHAKVKSIDSSEAMKMPGVIAVLTGSELVADKIGNLICGWAITSKDGTPMKMGAWPAMARNPWRSITRNCPWWPISRRRSPWALRSFTRRPRATSSTTGTSATRGR